MKLIRNVEIHTICEEFMAVIFKFTQNKQI